MRRKAKVDANQSAVVERFRQWGASVVPTHQLGNDVPDLVIGLCGCTHWVEIKDGAKPPSERKLSEGQQQFAREWHGSGVLLVETLDEVDFICARIRQGYARSFEDAIAPPRKTVARNIP